MYEEFNSIKNDLETLLIRLKNLESQIRKFDTDYIFNARQVFVYLAKKEVLELLPYHEQDWAILENANFFRVKKNAKDGSLVYLLEDLIWLKNQHIESINIHNVQSLIKLKNKKSK